MFLYLHGLPAARLCTLSLHDALPISFRGGETDFLLGTQMVTKGFDFPMVTLVGIIVADLQLYHDDPQDRKSTRLNSSHITSSYAVFCLQKKKGKLDLDRGHQEPQGPT